MTLDLAAFTSPYCPHPLTYFSVNSDTWVLQGSFWVAAQDPVTSTATSQISLSVTMARIAPCGDPPSTWCL